MTKIEFFKTMYGGKNQPPRYERSAGYGVDYVMDGNIIKLIFEKCKYDWCITEYSSGLQIRRNFKTRKEALNIVTPELLKTIAERLKDNKYVTMLSKYRANNI